MFQGFKVSNVSRLKPLRRKGTTFYLIIQIYADKIQKSHPFSRRCGFDLN